MFCGSLRSDRESVPASLGRPIPSGFDSVNSQLPPNAPRPSPVAPSASFAAVHVLQFSLSPVSLSWGSLLLLLSLLPAPLFLHLPV